MYIVFSSLQNKTSAKFELDTNESNVETFFLNLFPFQEHLIIDSENDCEQ